MCGHVFEIGDVYVDGAGSFGWPDRVKGLAEPLEAKYRLYAVSETGAVVLLSVAMIRGHNMSGTMSGGRAFFRLPTLCRRTRKSSDTKGPRVAFRTVRQRTGRRWDMDVQRKATPFCTFKLAVAGLTFANWSLLLVLGSLLVFAIVVAYLGWASAAGTDVPALGYLAMGLGISFSLLIGVGLMGLLFYSSRHGYDDSPVLERIDASKDGPIAIASSVRELASPPETRQD
jgi:hypothetical protein